MHRSNVFLPDKLLYESAFNSHTKESKARLLTSDALNFQGMENVYCTNITVYKIRQKN